MDVFPSNTKSADANSSPATLLSPSEIWRKLRALRSTASLTKGAVLHLVVNDPRLRKQVEESQEQQNAENVNAEKELHFQ